MDEHQDSPYCRRCGSALDSGVDFCPGCGTVRERQVIYVKKAGATWSSWESGFLFFGGLLVLVGLMPSFFLDTGLTGVTDTIRMCTSAGVASAAVGVAMLLFGVMVPRVRTYL